MKLTQYKYTCKRCGNVFKAPELPGDPYGEFLLRSKNGHMGYLLALDSSEFKDVSKRLKSNPKLAKLDDLDRSSVMHGIFGGVCDLAPDGSRYEIENMPACPECQSVEMKDFGAIYPPEILNEEIAPITFIKWTSHTPVEQSQLIEDLIDEYKSRKRLLGNLFEDISNIIKRIL